MAFHPERSEGSAFLPWALVAALVMPSSVLAQGEDKELDTPYVPTPQAVVNRMLELAEVKSGDTVEIETLITSSPKRLEDAGDRGLSDRLVDDDTERAVFVVLADVDERMGKVRIGHAWHGDQEVVGQADPAVAHATAPFAR